MMCHVSNYSETRDRESREIRDMTKTLVVLVIALFLASFISGGNATDAVVTSYKSSECAASNTYKTFVASSSICQATDANNAECQKFICSGLQVSIFFKNQK